MGMAAGSATTMAVLEARVRKEQLFQISLHMSHHQVSSFVIYPIDAYRIEGTNRRS